MAAERIGRYEYRQIGQWPTMDRRITVAIPLLRVSGIQTLIMYHTWVSSMGMAPTVPLPASNKKNVGCDGVTDE